MKKVYIKIHECKEGMMIGETLYNSYGAVIIAENTILDAHLIDKLTGLGIHGIRVLDQDEEVVHANNAELFKAQYNQNVQVIRDVLHDIATGKNLNMQKVNQVSDAVFERMSENRDIVGCINQIRTADEYTYTHCINVSLISMLIGKWMKLDPLKIKKLVQAGLLHDIGKSKIPKAILNKPSALTKEEFDEIKKHPVLGYRMIEKIPEITAEVKHAVLMHHEKEDGTGYPAGLSGQQINDFAKIISVADIYDAMTSNRVYHVKETPFEVFEQIESQAFGALNTRVVNIFLSNIAAFYVGDFVGLNTGTIAEIVHINPRCISRPLLKTGEKFIDLSVENHVKIVEMI